MNIQQLLPHKLSDYSTMYLDMDSFFASVEQYYDPSLRNQPVGVTTGPSKGASVIAASYEAKRCGVRTGTKVERALVLCPYIRLVHGSHHHYKQVHREFMSILHNTICYVEAKSIDEAFLKVPSYAQDRDTVFALLKAIKANIYDSYNAYICCSIGVASNIWLAKMAASSQKPNGQTFLSTHELEQFYSHLKLRQMTGIGRRMGRRLTDFNLETPLTMYNSSCSRLRHLLGVNGEKWYLRMHGYEVDWTKIKPQKSLGHQVTITQYSPSSLEEITTICIKISETLGLRLRKQSMKAQGLWIFMSFKTNQAWSNKIVRVKPFQTTQEIIQHIKILLKKLRIFEPLKKITITLTDLLIDKQIELLTDTHPMPVSPLNALLNRAKGNLDTQSIELLRSSMGTGIDLARVGFAGDLIRETSRPPDMIARAG